MSLFSSALEHWFNCHPDISQRQVCLAAPLGTPELSRFKSGIREPTLDAITKLLPAIEGLSDRTHALTILIAYLEDNIPDRYEPFIALHALDESTGEIASDLIRIVRDRWEDNARSDPDFARMWLTMDGYMHSDDSDATDRAIDKVITHMQAANDSSADNVTSKAAEEPAAYGSSKPKPKLTTGPGSGGHDLVRTDAMPSQHVAQEHEEI